MTQRTQVFKGIEMISFRLSPLVRLSFMVLLAAFLLSASPASEPQTNRSIQATDCFLRLKEHAEVPARDAGVLLQFKVELGDSVKTGDLLVSLDSKEAQLAVKLAEVDFKVASKQTKESVTVEIADATVRESAQLIEQAKADLRVAEKLAESDVAVRLGRAAEALAQDELDRTLESQRKFSSSVSPLEIARKEHAVRKSQLDTEQAQHDFELQAVRSTGRNAYLQQNMIARDRLKLEYQDATTTQGISALTADRANAALSLSREILDRRRILAPLSGIVVEQLKQTGEWVEAGEPVLRVINLETLLVKGYVDSDSIQLSDKGRTVIVTGTSAGREVIAKGKIVFVSPEIDSVNGQVMVKAEIRNPELRLRPGKRVEMTIEARSSETKTPTFSR
ncbi:MAG: HlyD family efflux transporter periplasmic adaptor subunit [Fuerstiella sp.]